MGTAFSVLRWTPSEFWSSNIWEYCLACNGYIRKKSGKKIGRMTWADVERLEERVRENDLRKRLINGN